jgi:hypothetical protein
METMNMTVAGLALLVGLFCRRGKVAWVGGGLVGLLLAMVLIAAVAQVGFDHIDVAQFTGHLVGIVLGAAVIARLGSFIRSRFSRSQIAPRAIE